MRRVDDKYKHLIQNAEQRNTLRITLTVLSLFVAFMVFAILARPGIALTADNVNEPVETSEPISTEETVATPVASAEAEDNTEVNPSEAIVAGDTDHIHWELYSLTEEAVLILSPNSSDYSYTLDELTTIEAAVETNISSGQSLTIQCTGNLTIFPVIASDNVSAFTQTAFCNKASAYDYSQCSELTSIPTGAFYNDTTVTSVILPTTITAISGNAFNGCTSLSSLTSSSLLENITIGDNAFSNCSSLTETIWNTIDKDTATISESAFTNAGVTYPEAEADTEESTEEEGISLLSLDGTTADAFSIDETTGQVTIIEGASPISSSTSGNAVGYLYQNTDGTQVLCIKQASSNTDYTSSDVKAIYDNLGLDTIDAIKFYGDNADSTYYGLKKVDSNLNSTATVFDFSDCASVESIENNTFSDDSIIKNIIFAEDSQFTSFGQNAFKNTTLNKITVVGGQGLQNLITIGNSAFAYANGISDFDFLCAEKITKIDTNAFANSNVTGRLDLSKFTNLQTIRSGAFSESNVLDKVIFENTLLSSIESSAFYQDDSSDNFNLCIKEFVIKNTSLTSIGSQALCRLKGTSKIVISDNPELTTLDGYAIRYCDNVTEVDLSNNPKLTNLNYSLQQIGYNRSDASKNGGVKINLSGCTSLTTLPSVGILSDSDYRTGVLGEIDLSNTGITSIPDNYFGSGVSGRATGQYGYLYAVNLSNCTSLTSIGENAFANDTNLESVNFSGTTALTTIGKNAFKDCESLKEIDLSGSTSLTTLSENAFNGCTELETLKINSNLTSVGANAFMDASAAGTTLTIGKDVTSICDGAFSTLNIKSVIFEESDSEGGRYITLGANAFSDCTPLSDMCESETKYWVDQYGNVYSEDKSTLYYISPTVTDYVLPDTVTTVASNVAKMATSLQSVAIGTNSELTEIHSAAFANCETLTKVIIDGSEYTDIESAEEALTSKGISKGSQIFYRTGITDTNKYYELPEEQLTNKEIEVAEGGQSASIYYSDSSATGRLDVSELGVQNTTGINARISNVDIATLNENIMYDWTGQSKTVNFQFQSDEKEGSTTKAYGRIYFKLSDENIKLYLGSQQINATDNGTFDIVREVTKGNKKVTETIHFIFKRVDNTDVYYLQCEEDVGDTYADYIRMEFDPYAGESATVQLWCDVVEGENEDPIYKPNKGSFYLQENWESAAWKWYVSYNAKQKDRMSVDLQKTDGTVQLSDSLIFGVCASSSATNGSYNSLVDASNNEISDYTYTGDDGFEDYSIDNKDGYKYGADPVQYIDYTQTLTLPTGMKLKDEITEGEGAFSVKQNAVYYTTSEGETIKIASINVCKYDESGTNTVTTATTQYLTNLVSVKNEAFTINENGTISFKWRVNNKNALNYSSDNNLKTFVNLVEWNDDIFQFDSNFNYNSDQTITCKTEQIPVRTYAEFTESDPQYKQTVTTNVTINASTPEFEIEKKVNGKDTDSIYLGNPAEFTLAVTNKSAALDGTPTSVTDDLPDLFKITTSGLYEMLVADETGKALTVTITKAYSSLSNGTMSDIVLTATNGGIISVQVSGNSYTARTQAELESVFTSLGFTVKSNTQYKLSWNSTQLDTVEAGGTSVYEIHAHVKNTFERLTTDEDNYKKNLGNVTNTGVVNYGENKNDKDTATVTPKYEVSIYKEVSGLNSADQIESGAELTYSLNLFRYGNLKYTNLPLTDTLKGTQVLLVPYEENKDNQSIINLNPTLYSSSDGTKYYKLNAAGEYTSVTVGQTNGGYLIADKITVTKQDSSVTTDIEWTLSSLNTSRTVTYKAIVDETAGTSVNTGTLTATNDAWLNNIEGDRLHANVSKSGVSAKRQSKYIILSDGSEAETSSIAIGETVTYELKLVNGSSKYNQTFTNVYDLLPATNGCFTWNNDNVEVTSKVETGDLPALSSVITGTGNETKICWNVGAGITLTPNQTLTITVKLTFPSDSTTWENYSNYVTGTDAKRIYNTLHTDDLGDSTVSHDLKIPNKAVLQKGVYDIYRNTNSSGTRTTYSIPTGMYSDYVLYYITLYNAGTSNLYLNNIEDTLPKGFTYAGLFNGTYGTINTNYDVALRGSKLANITDANFSGEITYATGTITRASTSTTNDVQRITFKLELNNYDDTYKAYYLEPNQALVIGYYAKAGNADLSTAVNTAVMQFNDKTGSGSVKATGVTISASNPDGVTENEGSQELITKEDASNLGFSFTDDTDVLKSDVAVTEGEMIPGVAKSAVGYITKVSDTKEEIDFTDGNKVIKISDGTIAGQDNTTDLGQKWKVTLYNTGQTAIDSYSITDTMEYPYFFYVNDNTYDKSEKTYVSLGGKELFYFKLLDIANKNYTITTYNGDDKQCQLGSEDNSDNSYSFTANGITFTLLVYQKSDKNFVMKLTVDGQQAVAVPAGDTVDLEFYTEILEGATQAYKEFENEVLFEPVGDYKTKSVEYGTAIPIKGNEEYASGIEASDTFSIVGTYGTTSEITVTEGNENTATGTPRGSTASCDDAINYIVLDRENDKKDFTYTLAVTNWSKNSLDKMVFVSNLPESNDQASTSSESRGSEFKVSLREFDVTDDGAVISNKNFGIKIYLGETPIEKASYLDENGETKLYTEGTDYRIQFSESSTLTTDDQTGTSKDEWMTYDDVIAAIKQGTLTFEKIRSYRVIINHPDVIGAESTTYITVPASISGDTGPDEYARCNFAYYYEDTTSGSTIAMQQLTKLVGVKTATAPVISKTLEVATGNETTATALNLSAKFIALSGSSLPTYEYGQEQAFLKAIYEQNNDEANDIEFTIMDLSSEDIDKKSTEYMTGLYKYQVHYDESTKTYDYEKVKASTSTEETPVYEEWKWNDNTSYTFYEFDLDQRAEFQTVNGNKVNGFTYTYTIEKYQSMEFVNKLNDYNLVINKLTKTDTDETLSLDGAGYARYKMIECNSKDKAEAAIWTAWNNDTSKSTSTDKVNALANKSDYCGASADSTSGSYYETVKSKNNSYQLSVPTINYDTSDISGLMDDSTSGARPVKDLTETTLDDYTESYFRYAYIIKKDNTYYACILMDLSETTAGSSSTTEGTAGITTTNGSITYSGVTDNSYLFMEVYAPSGYQLNYTLQEVTRNSTTDTLVTHNFYDSAASELPMTGGSGEKNILIAGLILMLLATVSILGFFIKNMHMAYSYDGKYKKQLRTGIRKTITNKLKGIPPGRGV